MHNLRLGCRCTPGKASIEAPSLRGELLSGPLAKLYPVETLEAHDVPFSMSRTHLSKIELSVWILNQAPYINSGLLMLKVCSPEMLSLLQIYSSSPYNRRRSLNFARSTIMFFDVLLVGLSLIVGPLRFQHAKPMNTKSRSKFSEYFLSPLSLSLRYLGAKDRSFLIHRISIALMWVYECQWQSLVQSNPSFINLHPSVWLLGILPLFSNNINGERIIGIMTPPLRSGGYRNFLNPMFPYPVISEPKHVQSTKFREIVHTMVGPALNFSKPRYENLLLLLTSNFSQWCGQVYELCGFHLSCKASLLLWHLSHSLRTLVIISLSVLTHESYCLMFFGNWILSPIGPSLVYGFGLIKVSLYSMAILPNIFKPQSSTNLARKLVKLLPRVGFLKPERSSALTPLLKPISLMAVAISSSVGLSMEELSTILISHVPKLLQEFGSKLSKTYC